MDLKCLNWHLTPIFICYLKWNCWKSIAIGALQLIKIKWTGIFLFVSTVKHIHYEDV